APRTPPSARAPAQAREAPVEARTTQPAADAGASAPIVRRDTTIEREPAPIRESRPAPRATAASGPEPTPAATPQVDVTTLLKGVSPFERISIEMACAAQGGAGGPQQYDRCVR